MAGAMAGSAICSSPTRTNKLHTVTITINNVCNLACPHCYLQYGGSKTELQWQSAKHVLSSTFKHMCIVGKEPLANPTSVALVRNLSNAVVQSGRTISIITNGLNLPSLDEQTLRSLKWIDVSIDADWANYKVVRGGSSTKLRRGLAYATKNGLSDLRILHTISRANASVFREMVDDALQTDCSMVVISPFQTTRASRSQQVSMLSPRALVDVIIDSGFASDERLRLIFDKGYLSQFEEDQDAISSAEQALSNRFINVSTDPITRGLIRVTYDGLVLSPFEAINTDDYFALGRPLEEQPLDEWYRTILSSIEKSRLTCH